MKATKVSDCKGSLRFGNKGSKDLRRTGQDDVINIDKEENGALGRMIDEQGQVYFGLGEVVAKKEGLEFLIPCRGACFNP